MVFFLSPRQYQDQLLTGFKSFSNQILIKLCHYICKSGYKGRTEDLEKLSGLEWREQNKKLTVF